MLVDDELKRPSIDAAFERIEKTARLFPETVVLLVDPPPDALRDLQRALPSIESARADGHDAAASSARALRIQPCSTVAAAAQLCVMTASHGADAARRRKGAEWVEQQYVEKLRAPHAPLDVWLKICAMLRVPESEGRLLLDIHESIAELSVVNFARLARSQKIPIDERTAFVLDALFGPSAETRSLEELGVLDGFPERGPTENYDGTRQDLGLAGLAPQASPRSTAPPEVRHHLPFRPVAADPSTRARSSDPYLHAPPSPPLPQRMMSSHNEWEPPPPPPPGHARGWRQDPVWAPQEQQFWPGAQPIPYKARRTTTVSFMRGARAAGQMVILSKSRHLTRRRGPVSPFIGRIIKLPECSGVVSMISGDTSAAAQHSAAAVEPRRSLA